MPHRKAFTLIELLIVVAIIAILAAIAVPNFLEAQVRAKVSRVRADLRSLATAVEAYRIDWNSYPIDDVRPILTGAGTLNTAESFFPPVLSTPISYMTSARIQDPFVAQGIPIPTDDLTYRTLFYQNCDTSIKATMGDTSAYEIWYQTLSTGAIATAKAGQGWGVTPAGVPAGGTWLLVYGTWKMGSVGPDRDYSGGSGGVYDATNGTISLGDIYRTQLRPEGGRQFFGF
jgi:prepilin-type N-terminal cleavage/methylation domain-containing protein